MSGRVLVIGTMLVLGALSCEKGVEPVGISRHNRILFTSSMSGKAQLYMMNPDGAELHQVTGSEYWNADGRWSPEATQIVCNTEEQSSTAGFSIAVMNVDGTNRRLLGWGSLATWSPDGTKLLFTDCTNCETGGSDFGLFLIDADGRNRVRLPVYGGYPDWSPDGTSVLLVAPDFVGTTLISHLMITHYPAFSDTLFVGPQDAGYGAWSPDGTLIAFSMKRAGGGVGEIYVMSASGASMRQVTSHLSSESYYRPRWSPDGSRLVFLGADGRGRSYLYMVGIYGFGPNRLLNDSTVTSADWSR